MSSMSSAAFFAMVAKMPLPQRKAVMAQMPAKRPPSHRWGQMNAGEADYASHLELRRIAGEVVWYAFESVTLILEDPKDASVRIAYTPDFIVITSGGDKEAHEIKGNRKANGRVKAFMRDDARVKLAWARQKFPWVAFRAMHKVDGVWVEEGGQP
jgi:hypothetical protein